MFSFPYLNILNYLLVFVWPLIPMYWLFVHFFTSFAKKIKFLTFILIYTLYIPYLYFLINNQSLLNMYIQTSFTLKLFGFFIFVAGAFLQLLTLSILKGRILGLNEFVLEDPGDLETRFIYKYMRHPTYLSHSLLFFGVFLISGGTMSLVVSIFDFLINNFLIIPFEERELTKRFGYKYESYKKRVKRYFFI
ncbi:Protein-S-isoprenylcysteine O-methyltransferase Ste14 [Thermodesulfobium acidiphilum]|uniref:Protein-S-isoprenylcysteine O-methyltransferase Ste14 n=1 Tax=Thermodesulfobium acidiphilum TaxID=1794699 RepID=A0A2R4W2B0_THEAF|nr:methyltransferase [Thermodesulfobium acidiphilum]AWB10860.1 Protein-S-isoprenylcysteine O-methyltransferase Ste14 [Thermodesulfobium acidiphilum]